MSDLPQLTREELQAMTAQEIIAAREAGRLDALLCGTEGEVEAARLPTIEEEVVEEAAPAPLRMAPRPEPSGQEEPPDRGQLSREDLQGMSAAEIMQADHDGRLDNLKRDR